MTILPKLKINRFILNEATERSHFAPLDEPLTTIMTLWVGVEFSGINFVPHIYFVIPGDCIPAWVVPAFIPEKRLTGGFWTDVHRDSRTHDSESVRLRCLGLRSQPSWDRRLPSFIT